MTGWGKDAFGKVGNFQQVLKRVEVPMVRKSTCENSLQDTRLGRGFRLHDGMSCAGGEEGKDACKVRNTIILSKQIIISILVPQPNKTIDCLYHLVCLDCILYIFILK